MRGGVARGETARLRRREDAFHTGPSTRAGRFETRAKQTTTGAQSEGTSESPLARHGASRAWSSLGTDDANGSAFRGKKLSLRASSRLVGSRANGYRQRRPRRSTIAWHHKRSSYILTHTSRRASRQVACRPSRLVFRGHLISEVSSPQSSRLPRVQQRPVRFPSLRRVLDGYARLRAQRFAVPARESSVEWAGSVRASDGRVAGRGGRRSEAPRARREISNAPLLPVHACQNGRPSALARVELAVSVVTRELKRRRCAKSGEEDGRCQRGGDWRCHGCGTRGGAGRVVERAHAQCTPTRC